VDTEHDVGTTTGRASREALEADVVGVAGDSTRLGRLGEVQPLRRAAGIGRVTPMAIRPTVFTLPHDLVPERE
jgi:hypothetical protein